MMKRLVVSAFAALLLGGCADPSGIESRATPDDPARLALDATAANAPFAPWPTDDWWTSLGDPELDRLIAEGLAGSPSLRVADARLRRAVAEAGLADAALYPSIDAAARSTVQRYTANDVVYTAKTRSADRLALDGRYTLDLWGGRDAAYRAALGEVRANEVEAQAARLDLAAAIATAYAGFADRAAQLAVSRELLTQKQEIADLTRQLRSAGLTTDVEAEQAAAAIAAAEADIARDEEAVAKSRQRIAALLGAGPDRGLAIPEPKFVVGGTLRLPAAIPAELIGRRPDIVALRWRIEAATAATKAAKAAFYPNVDIAAFVGLQSVGVDRLFKPGSAIAGVGPAITLPVFDAGRLRSGLARADAERDLAVETYNARIIDAVAEVAGEITAWRANQTVRERETIAVKRLERAYHLALLRYRAGLSNYLTVLSAEGNLIAERRNDAVARTRATEIAIALAHALGGGFTSASVGFEE